MVADEQLEIQLGLTHFGPAFKNLIREYWESNARAIGTMSGTVTETEMLRLAKQVLPFVDGKALELFAAFERGVYQALEGRKAA